MVTNGYFMFAIIIGLVNLLPRIPPWMDGCMDAWMHGWEDPVFAINGS